MRLEYILRFSAVVMVCLCSRCAARFLPKNSQLWSTLDGLPQEASNDHAPLQKTDRLLPEDDSISYPTSHRGTHRSIKRALQVPRDLQSLYIPAPRRRATVSISFAQLADLLQSVRKGDGEGRAGLKMNSLRFGRR